MDGEQKGVLVCGQKIVRHSEMNLQQIRKKTDAWLADLRHAQRSVKDEKASLDAVRQNIADATEAQQRLQGVAQQVQQQAHSKIAGVISRCLSAVFAEPYTFQIDFVEKRGKTEADLKFLRNGNEIDPLEASGGGVVDIVSMACRLACLMLARPQQRRFIARDEPFKHLSAGYVPAARQLLETLAEELDFQFVLVTHSEDLACGKVVQL